MMRQNKLQRWELALLLALAICLTYDLVFGAPASAWWGVVYPDLAESGAAQAFAADVRTPPVLRLRFLEWLRLAFG